jgi:hypothetical protein
MIVRILHEGKWSLEEGSLTELNKLDDELMAAVESGDDDRYAAAMAALLSRVKELGTELPVEDIRPSDFMLPNATFSLDEVRDLLSSDGLIPG